MDGSTLGSTVRNVTEANINLTIPYKLGWEIIDPSRFPSSSAVGDAILDEQAWVAIVGTSFGLVSENPPSTRLSATPPRSGIRCYRCLRLGPRER